MRRLVATSSQTVGPFFNFGLTADASLGRIAGDGALGTRIWLSLRLLDGDGIPVAGDGMIELWQADANGIYDHPEDPRTTKHDPNFFGFGRLETSAEGVCVFETVKPGSVPFPDGAMQAPHVNVAIFARGLLKQVCTRVYFQGEPGNSADPVIALVPAERRETLMAKPDPARPDHWHLDIRLQGEGETVFFEV
jgi:protocatechuate 3,4-dioxygenase, alpha subunit